MDCDPEFRTIEESEKQHLRHQLRDLYEEVSHDAIASELVDLPLHADLPPFAVGKDEFIAAFPQISETTELTRLATYPDRTLTVTLYFLQQSGSVGAYFIAPGLTFAVEAGTTHGEVHILKNVPFSPSGHAEASQYVMLTPSEVRGVLDELSMLYGVHDSERSGA